jgi:uncharacterized protein
VRTLDAIRESAGFDRFLGLVGALTSQEINTSQIGREVGVTPATARRWLDLLTRTYQWLELSPYHGNTIKRLSGKRKGYIRDTGTACSLQRVSSPEALAVSPIRGALFETWAAGEIHRQFGALAVAPHAYHWRTRAGAEVDVVLERDGRLYPVEVKGTSHLSGHDTRGLRAFRETYPQASVMTGLILYAGTECYRVNESTIAWPWNAMLDTR